MKNPVLLLFLAMAGCLLLSCANAKIRVSPSKKHPSAALKKTSSKAAGAAKTAAALVEAASGSVVAPAQPKAGAEVVAAAAAVGTAQTSSGKPVVCVVRLDPNFHHAASFRHGWYNKHGSAFEYRLKQKNSDMKGCKYSIALVSFNQAASKKTCTPKRPCVVVGDEFCSLSTTAPNVVGRQYYSSDYKTLTTFSLGSNIGFNVTEVDWPPRDKPRRYVFNYIGSGLVSATDEKKDRKLLHNVLDNANFSVPHFVRITKTWTDVELHNTPTVEEEVDTYRRVVCNSSFTLDPVGNNDECFRYWEAIQCGSIPIYVRRKWGLRKGETIHQKALPPSSNVPFRCPNAFENVLSTNPPIPILDSWDDLPAFVNSVTQDEIVQMQSALEAWNVQWWTNETKAVDNMIRRAFHVSNV